VADDLDLLAEKQVLDDEALAAANGGDDDGQDELDDFEHRDRIAGQDPNAGSPAFCHPRAGQASSP